MLASVIFVDFYLLLAECVITTKGVLLALSGIFKKAAHDRDKHSCQPLAALTVRLRCELQSLINSLYLISSLLNQQSIGEFLETAGDKINLECLI